MNIGALTVTLGMDASGAGSGLTAFQRQLLVAVNKMNASLATMVTQMEAITGAAGTMGTLTARSMVNITAATKMASTGVADFTTKIKAANAASSMLAAKTGGGTSLLALSSSEIRNAANEKSARSQIATEYKVTQAVVNNAIAQKNAALRTIQQREAAFTKMHARAIAEDNARTAIINANRIKEAYAEANAISKRIAIFNSMHVRAIAEDNARTAKIVANRQKEIAATQAALAKETAATQAALAKETAARQAAFANIGNNITTQAQKLRSFGWLATTVFTAPILMVGAALTKLGMEFEFTLSKMVGLANTAKSSIGMITKELLSMAKTTATAPQKLAETLFYVSSSGIKGSEALRVTELAAKGAASGMGDAVDVANLLTSAMNAYRASGLTAIHMMDVMTATIREGKGEPAEMVRSFGSVMLMAAEAGIKVEDLAGSFALLTLTTNSAANSATYLRQLLMTIMKPTPGEQDILARMNTSAAEMQKIFREGGIMAGLMKMRELTGQYGESMAELFPNLRAFLAMTGLTGQNLEYNQSVMKKFNDVAGDFNDHIAEMSKTMKWQWNASIAEVKASLTTLGMDIAKSLIPFLQQLAGWIIKIAKHFEGLSEAQKESRLRILAIMAVVGPFTLILATLGNALGTIYGWVYKVGKVMGGLSTVMKAMPWVIIATALVKVVSWMSQQTKEAEKAQIANSKLNTTLVQVNGEFKKLSELTMGDMKNMGLSQLSSSLATAYKIYEDAVNKHNELIKTEAANPRRNYKEVHATADADVKKAFEIYKGLNDSLNEYLDTVKTANATPFEPMSGKVISSLQKQQQAFEKAEQARLSFAAFKSSRDAANAQIGVGGGKDFAKGLPFETVGTGGWQKMLPLGPMERMASEMDLINKKSEIFGRHFDKNRALITYFGSELNKLQDDFDKGITPDTAFLDVLTKQMSAYVKEAEKAQIISSAFGNGVVQLAQAMGSAIGGMTDAWSSMAMIILQTTQQIIGALLAQAAANVYLAATAIARKEAMKGIWGLVTAAIGIAALIAMMQKANQDSKSAGMAKGGVVPQGYPNDSYPARLTSGETVVPPGKLPNLVKPSNIHVTVDGKILGKDLALVLRRANAYN